MEFFRKMTGGKLTDIESALVDVDEKLKDRRGLN